MEKKYSKKVFLFVNGEIKDYASTKKMLGDGDMIVAVDGGRKHIARMGLKPDLIIGDLDSISRDELDPEIPILRFPADKNETDLELAIDEMVRRNFLKITIVGGIGGRLDHTLGNIFLLLNPQPNGIDIRLDDGYDEIFVIRNCTEITGSPGDIVSLIPLGLPVHGVTTENLKWKLAQATLLPERTRGISNIMLEDRATVSITDGNLLCVHSKFS